MDTLTDENSISSTSEREFYGCMMNLCQWFESKNHTVGCVNYRILIDNVEGLLPIARLRNIDINVSISTPGKLLIYDSRI